MIASSSRPESVRALSAFGLALFFASFVSQAQVINGVDYAQMGDPADTFDMSEANVVGRRFASENLTYEDPVTGVQVIALTTSGHSNSKIYQTHPQWTPDGRYIVFRSNRAEGRHFYAISMENYEIVQVTAGDGSGGLHLGWKENAAYQFRDGQLVKLDLGGLIADSERDAVKDAGRYETVMASLPDGLRPSGDFGLDANEDRMFFGARLAPDLSAIYSVDFASGQVTKLAELPFRVNHMQANRWVSGEIMYCWETGGDAPQRTWLLSVDEEGKVNNRPAYQESAEEWVTHEVFTGPDHIMFNVMAHLDRLQQQPTGIFSMNIRTGEVKNHGQIGLGGFWHCDGTRDGKWAVGDSFDGKLYRINLETGEQSLLTAGHRPGGSGPFTDSAHSHHNISSDGRWVLFNSSFLNECDIMLVPLHPESM